ncbi:hypothetical protein BDN72DRAFT_146954 [Pluteus cervinus]|uniref:Uncharacterized protein n=1 Tax=Pluteus cervinus TaxID=181527 RepID=A0ACD3ALS2_9AGAR|nr:hypothetical protein BDN72DRAFT_146954 [Pluteus cervinus]
MRHVEMSIHFSEKCDPFTDERSEPCERTGKEEQALLGEIALSSLMQLSSQYRTHVFSMLVFPKSVRFLRWDRAGVIVTRKIPLAQSGNLVATFFHRLQFASPCARGVDETITTPRLSAEQETLIRQTLEVKDDVPLLQVTISGRRFVFPNSAFFNTHFARATRCFRAYNLDAKMGESKRGVFKDSWRILRGKNEFERNEKLRRAGVSNIPRIWCGEDVLRDLRTGGGLYHRTRTQEYQHAPWTAVRSTSLHTFRHYRQVMEELEGPLTSCRNMKDVVTALRDASQAEAEAYEKANIMHADCGLSNVMIKYEGDQVRGYLIDWDMSQDLDDDPKWIGPVGQWRFMAARIQSYEFWEQGQQQDQVDDTETFFHDLVYVIVYYTRCDTWRMDHYFNGGEKKDGIWVGGERKISSMGNEWPSIYSRIRCPRIQRLVKRLAVVLHSRYVAEGHNADKGSSQEETRKNSTLLYSDPYWMSKVLTEELEKAGWPEDKLIQGNDPAEMDPDEVLDWGEIADQMKRRASDEGENRKKRRKR